MSHTPIHPGEILGDELDQAGHTGPFVPGPDFGHAVRPAPAPAG